MPQPLHHVFFLGGQDLEMATIRSLLEAHAPSCFHDARLGWGEARASRYESQIEAAMKVGRLPVLVELEDDLGLPAESIVVVDHHGSRSGASRSTALEQVFTLLGLSAELWTRWFELVAANDRGYLDALAAVGASREEMARVRAADRQAQGITPSEEQAAEAALETLETRSAGRLLVVDLPHGKTATVVDRLASELGGPGFEVLLIRSPGEANVFAPGPVIQRLAEAFPEGWYGGNLPAHGYFGGAVDAQAVLQVLEDTLAG